MKRNRGILHALLGSLIVACLAFVATPAHAMSALDVSSHQSGIDVRQAGTDIVIAKATESDWYVNPDCDRVVQDSLRAGKATGVYHFADTGRAAKAEADFFVTNTRGYIGKGVMPILDWEPRAPGDTAWARQWLDIVQQAYGVKPMIYMQLSTENAYDWSAVVAGDYGLWLAGGWYYNTALTKDQAPNPYWRLRNWPHAAMWQYTSNGRVYGWSGGVDLSEFYGDFTAWNKYAKANAVGPVNPPVQEPARPSGAYVVRTGDCLSLIAPRVGMSWTDLANLNRLRPPYTIYPGQTLRTSGRSSGGYTVVAGDTVWSIAASHGVPMSSIHGFRSGNPNMIYPGETLYW